MGVRAENISSVSTITKLLGTRVVDGVPGTGNITLEAVATQMLGTSPLAALVATGLFKPFADKATIDASLAYAADTIGWVYADTTVANNGIYRKSGSSGSGSWSKILPLPYSVARAAYTEAGTVDAILAESDVAISEQMLVVLDVEGPNTASPVTVAFNGGTALTIKTAAGSNVPVGALVSGIGVVSGSNFRLLTDLSSAAIQAAAAASAAAALASQAAAALSESNSATSEANASASEIVTLAAQAAAELAQGAAESARDDSETAQAAAEAATYGSADDLAKAPNPDTVDALAVFVDAADKAFGTVEADGTWVLPAIKSDGGVSVAGELVTPSVEDTVEDDLYVVRDAAEKVLFRIDRDGKAHFDPDADNNAEIVDARGSRADLDTRLSHYLAPYGAPKHRFGRERLRETSQRLICRRLGESRQLVIASNGDSYTFNAARWTGPAAERLISLHGDAGGGWLGFGSSGGASDNGNVRPSSYSYARSGSGWAYTVYTSGVGPDLGQITSSTAADKVTIGGPASPVLSAIKLLWIGTANGVVRYRYNGGSWTSLNVQGSVGTVQSADLSANMPASGTWTLEIEVVSGTVTLCGIDIKSAASGIRWHKLGATGSTAQQWAAVNATQWQAGLALLDPNLIILMLGTNDQGANRTAAQFAADMATLMDRCRAACPTADLLVMMPPENQRVNTYAMADYAAATLEEVAARDAAWCDTQLSFGVAAADYASGSARPWFNADTIHPDPTTGGRALVASFLDMIGVY